MKELLKYPNPQFIRENYISLNGEWEFEIDNAPTIFYWQKKYQLEEHLSSKIIVPFPVESELSKVNNKDFNLRLWYKKKIEFKKEWENKNILLCFGAIDYEAYIYVNGIEVFNHVGGYTPFKIDITKYLNKSINDVTIKVLDDARKWNQPSGKQSNLYESYSALYTRVSGIWQDVYLEIYDTYKIEDFTFKTKNNGEINIDITFNKSLFKENLEVLIYDENEIIYKNNLVLEGFSLNFNVFLKNIKIWEINNSKLYKIVFKLKDNKNIKVYDEVISYFAFRDIAFNKTIFMLNNKPLFQRLILDQGYYKKGIYTYQNFEELELDIINVKKLGFNGVRMHQKVFDPRYLFLLDYHGLIAWDEYPSFGLNISNFEALSYMLPEWIDVIKRDKNHPSIVVYAPFNETETNDYETKTYQDNKILETVYKITKVIDPTRFVIDTSGSLHSSLRDIYDVHDYEQNIEIFKTHYLKGYFELYPTRQNINEGEPYMVTEYGGILFDEENNNKLAWGYGEAPKDKEEFLNRFKELTLTLLKNPNCSGFCYTQLYDVEQEKNGLLTYERKFKFDPDYIKKIVTTKAKIEE